MNEDKSAAPVFEPNYCRMFLAAVECLAIIDKALDISEATHIVGGAGPALHEIQKLKDNNQRVTAERDALQLLLTERDQRIDELENGHSVPPTLPVPVPDQFLEDHLGKMPDQFRDATKMIDAR